MTFCVVYFVFLVISHKLLYLFFVVVFTVEWLNSNGIIQIFSLDFIVLQSNPLARISQNAWSTFAESAINTQIANYFISFSLSFVQIAM